ncbi:hypothetical protein [Mycobacterium europaeum]|uniref:hypothetical protein n=1 Tax=Mycobacterium europaeum TaxID=761804 RepID=UPI000B01DDDD|nr:hypothetical protein [Mycobacterium europaeum]
MTQLLDGRVVLGDGGYRGITSITAPRRDKTGRIIRNDLYRTYRRISARVEHVIAGSKTDKCSANAAAAATPSTTASKPSVDSGPSRPIPNLRVNA